MPTIRIEEAAEPTSNPAVGSIEIGVDENGDPYFIDADGNKFLFDYTAAP